MKRNPEILSLFTEWLLILSCFGYPLQAMVVLASRADSSPINMAFRAFYLLLAVILLLSSLPDLVRFFKTPKLGKTPLTFFNSLTWPVIILLLFWIIYGIRLVYELKYQDWHFQNYSDLYIYSWAFGVTLLPALAVLVHGDKINMKRLARNLLLFLFLANLCIIFSLVYYSPKGLSGIFGSRGEVLMQIQTEKPDTSLLNSITIGLFGEWLALASLAYMFFFRKEVPFWQSLLLLCAFMLGIFNLFAGASRGPLLDFLLILFAIAIIGTVSLIKYFLKLRVCLKFKGQFIIVLINNRM